MYNTSKGVSVIIPCYNREKTIINTIKSVLSQNYNGKIEVIISDDGSTDSSVELIKRYNNKITILEKPSDCTEQGASSARNRGLKFASCEYVCFLDSDDYYLPNYFNTVLPFLDENPDIGYTFCRSKMEVLNKDGARFIENWTRESLSVLDTTYHVLYRAYNINTNVICVRKSIIDKVGFFDTSLSNGEDTDMWLRISEVAKGQFLNIYGAVYRVNHSDIQLSANSRRVKRICSAIIYTNSIQRYIAIPLKDKLRLLLIVRMLLYMNLSFKEEFINRVFRLILVNFRLFILFPFTYFRFLYYAFKKR